MTASCILAFNDSLKCTCKNCVDDSICHFKFPKVAPAHISSEVGTFYTILLNIYSRTCVPIFIEIGSYLRDRAEKDKLARF